MIYSAVVLSLFVTMVGDGCRKKAEVQTSHQERDGTLPAAHARQDSTVSARKRRACDVDDQLRAKLTFKYEHIIEATDFACFSFVNRSSEVISLPGDLTEQLPGRKVYMTRNERFFLREGNRWKQINVDKCPAGRDFDVYPGSEITLLIRVLQAYGEAEPFKEDEKFGKIALGNIYSDEFRYKLELDYLLQAKDGRSDASPAGNTRSADDVDDQLRAKLRFKYEGPIPGTQYACFSFVNHSSEIISLPNNVGQAPGRKVYCTYFEKFYLHQSDGWKDISPGYDGMNFGFDVNPGSEVTLIIRVVHNFGNPSGKKHCKVGLGKICSESFRY
ncbi:MAG: hypothetical protein WCV00_15270 [Verrucomicrobiia bacterium]